MVKSDVLYSFRTDTFHCTVHKPSKFIQDVLKLSLPDAVPLFSRLYVVICFQKTSLSLYSIGSAASNEKNRLLEKFYEWGSKINDFVSPHYTELIDPSSGGPMLQDGGSSVYSDLEGIQDLLCYPMISVAGCSVTEHPEFKANCYPSTLFCAAPLTELTKALEKISTEEQM